MLSNDQIAHQDTLLQRTRMKTLSAVLVRLNHTDVLLFEIFSFVAALMWACILALPGQTFSTAKAFFILSHIASENEWAFFIGCLAAIPIVALAIRSIPLRLIGLLLQAMFWCLLAISVFISNPISTGWAVYGLLGLGSGWVALRLVQIYDISLIHVGRSDDD